MRPGIIVVFINLIIILLLLLEERADSRAVDATYENLRGFKEKEKPWAKIINEHGTLIKQGIPFLIVAFFFGVLVFRNVLFSLVFSVSAMLLIYWYMTISARKKSREVLQAEFREAMLSMSNSLKSGASLQTAIVRARSEMEYSSAVKNSILRNELDRIISEINLGLSMDETLENFKERVKSEEVDSFVNAAVITNKVGGDLSEVMIRVCEMIGDKIEIKREITTLTAGKRSESNILSIAPMIMIPLLFLVAPGYLAPMFSTALGKVLMGIAVLMLMINFVIAKKITDIKL